jgi:hypothetical protein
MWMDRPVSKSEEPRGECPMCGPSCVGGAHYNQLMEDGIRTRKQWVDLIEKNNKKRRLDDNAQAK